VEPGPADFVPVNHDATTYAEQGYEVVTFELNPEAHSQYASLDNKESNLDTAGNEVFYRPTFFVVRPVGSEGQSLVDLIWFHGGTIADDRDFEESGEMPMGCVPENIAKYAQQSVSGSFLPLVMAMEQGWAMVVPRNDWCDYWTGLGALDPVDPDRHYGYYHVNRIFEFLASGAAAYKPSGIRYAWGTSAGGGAAIHIAHKQGGFKGIVVDSAPSSMMLYHKADPEAVESFLGGPPTDASGNPSAYYQAYTEVSSERLISDHGFRVPIAMLWNSKDELLSGHQPKSLEQALQNEYAAESVPWLVQDFNHAAPGTFNHTQAKQSEVPWGYTGLPMVAFLRGKEVTWLEAEAGCRGASKDACTVGGIKSAEQGGTADLKIFSQGAVMQSLPEAGEGILWQDTLPEGLPRNQVIDAIAVVQLDGLEEVPDEDVVAYLAFHTNAGRQVQALTRSMFATQSDATIAQNLHQYRSTRIQFTIPEGETPTMSWRTMGFGRTRLDAILFLSENSEEE